MMTMMMTTTTMVMTIDWLHERHNIVTHCRLSLSVYAMYCLISNGQNAVRKIHIKKTNETTWNVDMHRSTAFLW